MEILKEEFIKSIEDFNQVFSINLRYPYQPNHITTYDLVRSPLRRRLLEEKFSLNLEIRFFLRQFFNNLFPIYLKDTYCYNDFIICFSINKVDSADSIFNYYLISQYSYLNKFINFYEREMQIIKFIYEKKYSKKVSSFGNIFFLIDYSFKNKIESPIVKIKYKEDEGIEEYFKKRIELHKEGSFCSDEDMMIDLSFIAGNKKFKALHEAQAYALKNKKEIRKELKPIGCLFYCPVKDFCPQFEVFCE